MLWALASVCALGGLVAAAVQFKLWGMWDEATKRTTAPPRWLRVHAAAGYVCVVAYLLVMVAMGPRLVGHGGFPASPRAVVHAGAGLLLGVVLVVKVSAVTWARHFEESAPKLGFAAVCLLALVVALALAPASP